MTKLAEAKQMIAYAKKLGAKSLKWGGLEITFQDVVVPLPLEIERSAPKSEDHTTLKSPDPAPTLDDINQYIYGANEEPHEPIEQH